MGAWHHGLYKSLHFGWENSLPPSMTGAKLTGSIVRAVLLPRQLKFKIIWSPGNLFHTGPNYFPRLSQRRRRRAQETLEWCEVWNFWKTKSMDSVHTGKEQSGYRGRKTVSPYPCIQNTQISDFFFKQLLLRSHILDSSESSWVLSRSDSSPTASSSVTWERSEILTVLPSVWEDRWPGLKRWGCLVQECFSFWCCKKSLSPWSVYANVGLSRAGDDGSSLGICPMGIRLQTVLC